MKRIALAVAVLALAACGEKKEEAPAAAVPAAAPMADTTAKPDTTTKPDTTKMAAPAAAPAKKP